LTKASLYAYFGPVAVLNCRHFDLSPLSTSTLSAFSIIRRPRCASYD